MVQINNKPLDLSKYLTQAQYAKLHGYKLGTVSQWIKRLKAGESIPHNIEYLEVPELNITLIKK